MHRHANGSAILTVRREQSEKRSRREKTRRKGSPAHAATVNDRAVNAAVGTRHETCYSVRNTRIGSVEAARCAGTKQASTAAASSTHPTAEKAERSSALTP